MRVNRLLHDTLLAGVAATPDKTVLVVDGQRLTYAELLDSARRFAAALQSQGLERGDRVVVFTDNSLPCVVSIFGTLIIANWHQVDLGTIDRDLHKFHRFKNRAVQNTGKVIQEGA